jgi:hypothetical protein
LKLVLDSGAVTLLAKGDKRAAAMIRRLLRIEAWPPVIPSAVLVECLTGRADRDARTNQFLKRCQVNENLSTPLARRAATLRRAAGRGSAVDAIVVAIAEPAALVLTSNLDDLTALAEGTNVIVRGI